MNLLDLLAALATQAAPVLEPIHLQRQIEHQSLHDSLTGLPNRLSMQHRLRQLLAEAERHGTAVAVLFLDVDGFKAINDTFGHEAGDRRSDARLQTGRQGPRHSRHRLRLTPAGPVTARVRGRSI